MEVAVEDCQGLAFTLPLPHESEARTPSSHPQLSLTQELAAEVSSRVDSGMYTSASELIREALRLLLRSEILQSPRQADAPDEPLSAHRFHEAVELMDLADLQETGPGLRMAPERLSKLKVDEQS